MALPSARLASFREVPVVDLSAAWQGTAAARRRLAEEIVEACERVGFLYIAGHRVEPGSIDGIFAMARRFFALPLAEKMRVSFAGSRHFRGYLPLGAKGSVKQPEYENLHEGFQIYAELAADDPDVLAGKPLHGPNLWPPALPELRLEILRYHGALAALGCAMLRLFALGLGLEEEFFLQFYRKPLMQLRLLRYPPPDPALHARHLGVRAHSDTGAFTILAQDDTGGLEVMNREEEWIAVPPRAGSFVVNIGEMMKVWTDGRFSSTSHRVINRSGRERYSVPFFVNPDFEAVIVPAIRSEVHRATPRCHSTIDPAGKTRCGEALLSTYRKIWPSADGSAEHPPGA